MWVPEPDTAPRGERGELRPGVVGGSASVPVEPLLSATRLERLRPIARAVFSRAASARRSCADLAGVRPPRMTVGLAPVAFDKRANLMAELAVDFGEETAYTMALDTALDDAGGFRRC